MNDHQNILGINIFDQVLRTEGYGFESDPSYADSLPATFNFS